MKKIIIIIIALIIISIISDVNNNEKLLIPAEAIRLRVLANSDSQTDQIIKMQVKNVVQDKVMSLINGVKNIDEVRHIIKTNLNVVDSLVSEKLQEYQFNTNYKISYGDHYFPEKNFMGIKYPAGNYESLLVELGAGKGKNWWCLLFPPLCLIEVNEHSTEVEYKFMVKEILKLFF